MEVKEMRIRKKKYFNCDDTYLFCHGPFRKMESICLINLDKNLLNSSVLSGTSGVGTIGIL